LETALFLYSFIKLNRFFVVRKFDLLALSGSPTAGWLLLRSILKDFITKSNLLKEFLNVINLGSYTKGVLLWMDKWLAVKKVTSFTENVQLLFFHSFCFIWGLPKIACNINITKNHACWFW